MNTSNLPSGASVVGVRVWDDVYAVAANWAQASAPVYVLCGDGWVQECHGRQVADFRHRPKDALASHLREVAQECGDELSDARLAKILARSFRI